MNLENVLLTFLQLVRRHSPGSMSAEQYAKVASCVFSSTKGVLIFGLGYDTKFWSSITCGRLLTVIEDNPAWIAAADGNDVEIIEARYTSKVGQHSAFPDAFREIVARGNEWATVFVDGPKGVGPDDPGREQSIRLASEIRVRSGAAVFLHDYERSWELRCSALHLGCPDEVVASDKDPRLLAYWKETTSSVAETPPSPHGVGGTPSEGNQIL